MLQAELTVRRLRLASQVAAPRVADALRISAKPAALLHRHVLVRRMRLRAAPGMSAQSLALLFERAWLRIAALAEPVETAPASAEAVWAASPLAASQALLRRWLRGEAADAWFWQRVAPPALGRAWPQRALDMMRMAAGDVTAMHESPGRIGGSAAADPARVRALLAVIAGQQMAGPFVTAIEDADAQELLTALETPPLAPRQPVRRDEDAAIDLATSRPATARERLLARMEARPARPEPGLDGRSAAQPRVPASARAGEAPHDTAAASESAVQARRSANLAPPQRATLPLVAAAGTGLQSAWAGLWLMLPILRRQGLDEADDPLADWGAAQHAAARRFRVADDEPLHAAIAALDLPAGGDAERWLRRARLAAVRDARLPLLRIARRRGVAWVSAERIDIEFAAADVRIRRAGFDINPGFVPWLGRIVHFHYPP